MKNFYYDGAGNLLLRVSQAQEPLRVLHKIDQTDLPLQKSVQIQTFLNKLTGIRVGFTAWKTFTVDFGAILSVN